jgi:hypothetical protein
MTLANELRGEVRRGKRAGARVVILNGWSEIDSDSLVERRAKQLRIRRKNAKQWEKRRTDPVVAAARADYMREWRRRNNDKVKGYRATYRKTHAAWARKYQREWKRARYQPVGQRRGEANLQAKLTPAQVVEMRETYARWRAEGKRAGFAPLGKLYGVSYGAARKIVRREMWAHV